MRLTKIYTKLGDGGTTMLANGEVVPKDHIRIETYGTIDELNAFLGLWRDTLLSVSAHLFHDLAQQVTVIQNEMHDLGAELATPNVSLNPSKQQVVTQQSIERLEREIDAMNLNLPPLKNFVLPGGSITNSHGHVCRTICRRAERLIVHLAHAEPIRSEASIYLNRLSDWLFVASREISRRLATPEILWQQRGKNN